MSQGGRMDRRLHVETFGPDDAESVEAYAQLENRVRAVDSPWMHPLTLLKAQSRFRFGWDDEPPVPFLLYESGSVVGHGSCSTSEYDNLHLAWWDLAVHPDHRRRGLGTALLEVLLERTHELSRTSAGIDGWESPAASGFASKHGFSAKSQSINRRQHLAELDWTHVRELHGHAASVAGEYELVGRVGPTPDEDLPALSAMVESINDAPTDDLDIEDEVFPPERIRAYETAMIDRGLVLHRLVARHRGSGELAGHTIVAVDQEQPEAGEQHDTTVVGAHRGHRLGLLLKSGMNLWLREVQPQLETIDTWNAESNDHMIAVNDALNYRIMGRAIQYQRSL